MTTEKWLKQTTAKLEAAGIGTARLDALVLLEDATGHNRSYLLAHPELDVKGSTYHKLEAQLKRRAEHEPLAYIRGKTEFYGRDFLIDERVLEPRPESETMIDLLKTVRGSTYHIVDVGTGSGALAITAKLELPEANVTGIDIDPECIRVAKKNAQQHHVEIEFMQGNLLKPLSSLAPESSILLCNLPYVPDSFTINTAAMREPSIAIFGGADGLNLYRQLFKQISDFNLKVQCILTESMPPQHSKLEEIANKYGYMQTNHDDFIQLFRRP